MRQARVTPGSDPGAPVKMNTLRGSSSPRWLRGFAGIWWLIENYWI
jgi:hypothetical protein